MYWHTTDIVNTAVMARGPAKEIKPSKRERKAQKQTAWTGVCVREFIRYKNLENGSPWSRENAKI